MSPAGIKPRLARAPAGPPARAPRAPARGTGPGDRPHWWYNRGHAGAPVANRARASRPPAAAGCQHHRRRLRVPPAARRARLRLRHDPGARPGARSGAGRVDLGGRRPAGTRRRCSLPGLHQPVTVSFTAQGVASISARQRPRPVPRPGLRARQVPALGDGRGTPPGRGPAGAARPGPADLASDEFELGLGLLRTAQPEWAQMPKASLARPGAAGLRRRASTTTSPRSAPAASGRPCSPWPGVYPGPWTPVDSLVIQGVLTQELDFTTDPARLRPARALPRRGPHHGLVPDHRQERPDPLRPRPLRQARPDPAGPRRRQHAQPASLDPDPGGRRDRGSTTARSAGPRPRRSGGEAARPAQPAARRSAAPLPRQQRVGRQRARGRRAAAPCWRGPAPAADAAVGLVRGRPVRAGLRRGRGQRAGPARDPDRAQRAHRLVADRHAEPGDLLLRRANPRPTSTTGTAPGGR